MNVDGVLRTLEHRGASARSPRSWSGLTRVLRHHAAVPRTDGTGEPRRAAVDRRLRVRARRWSKRSRKACASNPTSSTSSDGTRRRGFTGGRRRRLSMSDPSSLTGPGRPASDCRRFWRAPVSGATYCDDLIADGRVRVNGEIAELGRGRRRARPGRGRRRPGVGRAGLVYSPSNKPAGVVTTADDPQGRPTVVGLVPDALGLPGGPARHRHRGSVVADQRRRPHPSADPSELRRREGVPGAGRGQAGPRRRKLREGVELDDGITAPAEADMVPPGLVELPSTRVATPGSTDVRGDRPSRCTPGAHRSARSPLDGLKPGGWRMLTTARYRWNDAVANGRTGSIRRLCRTCEGSVTLQRSMRTPRSRSSSA